MAGQRAIFNSDNSVLWFREFLRYYRKLAEKFSLESKLAEKRQRSAVLHKIFLGNYITIDSIPQFFSTDLFISI
jgi:hypothetical protein